MKNHKSKIEILDDISKKEFFDERHDYAHFFEYWYDGQWNKTPIVVNIKNQSVEIGLTKRVYDHEASQGQFFMQFKSVYEKLYETLTKNPAEYLKTQYLEDLQKIQKAIEQNKDTKNE